MKNIICIIFLFAIRAGFSQNGNLVTYGIPDSISMKPDPNVSKYKSKTDFPPFIGWDKSGRHILLNGGQVIYSMKKPDGSISEKYKLEQNYGSCFSPDRKDFLFLEDNEGDENYQLFRYNIASKETTAITQKGFRSSDPFWKPDGSQILYKSNKRKRSEADLYLRNTNAPFQERLILQNVTDEALVYDWDEVTNTIILVKVISENHKELFLINLNDSSTEQINPEKSNVAYSDAKFLKGKEGCLVVSDAYSEFLQLQFYSFRDKSLKNITKNIPWDVNGFSIDKKGKQIAFTVNENGISSLYIMNTTDFAYKKVDALPSGIIAGLEINAAGTKAAFNFYGSTFNRKVYSYDLISDKLEQWTIEGRKPFADVGFVAAEHFNFQSRDSLTGTVTNVPAFIYRPVATGKHPVYIDVHGGPEYQALPVFNRWHQYLVNELHMAVIVPNVRGSNGYGTSYMRADDGEKRENAIKDIGALLQWIAMQSDLDKNKVAIYGESYGGYVVLSSLAHYPQKIKCGIDVVGISNWVTYLENTSDYRKDLRRAEFGDERQPETRRFLSGISPVSLAGRIKAPVYIVQGYNDPRVNYTESEKIVDILKKQNGTVWYLMAKNEGHGFKTAENRTYQRNAEIAFLKKYLLNN